MNRRLVAAAVFVVVGLGWSLHLATAGGRSFDKLTDEDRKVFAERFEREVWPLLVRGGKDGCVGCHRGGKIVSALRFSGNVDKDFRMLLREGFFLHPDDGSLLGRLIDKEPKRRMPVKQGPGNNYAPADPWPDTDIQVLRQFVVDLQKKEKK